MPNLVGIGNSQVPTNAMLGGLAYQDSVGEINIDKIKARTSDTALDIFVYDTSKDSDGGAWRHRTQNTSWYNEGASATRGARKEFPAVAVIVAEEESVSIYDGDDPNLPLWMKFNAGSGGDNIFNRPTAWDISAVFALNGIVCITNGANSAESTLVLNYVNDSARLYPISGYPAYGGDYTLGISGRSNSSGSFTTISQNIVGDETFDVAMTVLPNAPIDASTELPVPTIAVGTGHGVSVIKDDGTISNLTPGGGVEMNSVSFDKNNNLVMGRNNFILYRSDHPHYLSNQVDNGYTVTNRKITAPSVGEDSSGSTSFTDVVGISDSSIAFDTQTLGLGLYDVNAQNNSNSMVAYIRATHNTGWMIGNTVVSTLSSTEVGINTSGANIFQNGTFDSDISGWQNWDANRGTVTYNNGRMRFNNSGTGDVYAVGSFDHTVPPGTIITVSGNYYSISGGNATMVQIYPYNGDTNTFPNGAIGSFAGTNGTNASSSSFSGGADGTFHITTTVTSHGGATAVLLGLDPNVSTIFELDNLTCTYTQGRLSDHTTNGQDYVTFGSVTKTPVADGAELMAFGNFSSSNYIRAGTNSNLEMGSGDFHYIFWVNPNNSSSGKVLLSHWSYNVDSSVAGRVGIYFNSGNVRLDLGDDNTSSGQYQAITGANRIQNSNEWHMVCAIRRGNTAELWVDGKLDASQVLGQYADGTYSNKKRIVEIGYSPGMGSPDDGIKVTLLRIGKTRAPSKEQIEKMYKDELQLFGENAKCTLFGSAAAITGLAFDDSTNVVHAGTSVGRSDFRGLVRINNTETPVTHDISASNGLVIEQ